MISASGYNLTSYGDMSISEPRMSVYVAALRRAVTPGCTVIDLGCGPGVFALLACKFGAGHVYAIEPDPSIRLGLELAKANGMADRITFFQGLSTDFVPPQPADVLISDIRGALPLFEHHVATIRDARSRLLRPGGVQLPQGDVIRLALVNLPEEYERITRPWSADFLGLDLRAGRRFVTNEMSRPAIKAEAMLSDPRDVIRLDYRTIDTPNAQGTVELTARGEGVAHGLAVWFDAMIDDKGGYSNAPGEPRLVYGHSFMPFPEPMTLDAGDRIEATLRADLLGGAYEWTWQGRQVPADPAHAGLAFRQSTARSRIPDARALAPRAGSHRPQPGEDLAIAAAILSLVDGERSNDRIAEEMTLRYPARFQTHQAALDHVAGVTSRFAGAVNTGTIEK